MHRSEQHRPETTLAHRAAGAPQRGLGRVPGLARAALLVALALSATERAEAQSTPQQLAEINRNAMESYNNLEIEQAKAALEKAARNADKNGIHGPALARTLANLAVVLVGGFGDQPNAIAIFTRALKEDPKVEPDPIVATPEVMAAFNAARSSSGMTESASTLPPTAVTTAPPKRRPSVHGNLEHTPVPEQLTQTAIPVFVAKSPELEVAKMKIFYRALGLKKPKSGEMQETDDGFTFLIPCADVFEPVVEYFVVALDAEDNQIGNAGSPEHPISIPIVAERTEAAPSLPGQVPPAQCAAENECPPGMPGCGGGAGLGETCSQDSDCQSGLVCADDFCSAGARASSSESSTTATKHLAKRMFVDVNLGVGLTHVGSGRSADREPSAAVIDGAASAATMNAVLDPELAADQLRAQGYDCQTAAVTVMDQPELQAKNCKVAVNPGGFVPVPLLNLAVGYYLTPRFALALTGRVQFRRGQGPLAGLTVGGRGEYLLTKPARDGARFGLLAGVSVGQIQARPPAEGSRKGPFATNANINGVGAAVTLGARAGYRFVPNFGVNFTPAVNLGLPNFLLALDLSAGIELAF